MRTNRFFLLLSGLFICCSCSKHIYVNYQTEIETSGKVVLKPTRPTEKTYVAINDSIIVEKKYVKSVAITNVPDGEYTIQFSSGVDTYTDKLDVQIPFRIENGNEVTKHVAVSKYKRGYLIYLGAVAITPMVYFILTN